MAVRIEEVQSEPSFLSGLERLVVPIESLVLLPGNPRIGDVEAVAASLRRFGQRKPVVVHRGTSEVIAGNTTLKAAISLGWPGIAAVFADDDQVTAHAFALADNRTSDLGTYDDSALAAMLAEVAEDGDLFMSTSFDEVDLSALMVSLDVPVIADGGGAEEDVYSAEDVASLAVDHYLAAGIPALRSLPVHECMQQINRLARTDSENLRNTTTGYRVADSYHPHRIATRVTGALTAQEVFERPGSLRHLIEFLIANDIPISDQQVLSKLAFIHGGAIAANFRPGFALLCYRRYCQPGAVVLDTSTGYGGRLVGFLASSAGQYIGIDPNVPTHHGNGHLAADMQAAGRVELINLPAEDVDPSLLAGRCDFAFTSPPYFAKEQYSDDATQSCQRYGSGEAWRDGFLWPMLSLQYAALRRGSYSLVNVADVKLGTELFPLVRWTIEAALAAGFEHVRTEQFPLRRVPGSGTSLQAFEPVLAFRKPEKG